MHVSVHIGMNVCIHVCTCVRVNACMLHPCMQWFSIIYFTYKEFILVKLRGSQNVFFDISGFMNMYIRSKTENDVYVRILYSPYTKHVQYNLFDSQCGHWDFSLPELYRPHSTQHLTERSNKDISRGLKAAGG